MASVDDTAEGSARTSLRSHGDVRLLLDACRNGDATSRERLVELSMPLVRSLARRYANRGERLEDLVQVGTVGLIEAIDRFDQGRGDDFFRFAVPTITGAIRHHLRDLAGVVRVPRGLIEQARAVELRDPALARPVSLSNEADGGTRLDAALVSDGTYEASDDRLLLAAGFRTLRERERRILHLHFFAGLSQEEIAHEVGLSQVQVSRLIRASLERMRGALDVRDPVGNRRRSLAPS